MRKLIIFICILITGGAVYALVPSLFPDTPLFPRVPTAEGTIGGILEKLLTRTITDASQDGSVKNTAKLDGVSASGYLKNTTCLVTEKWIGIDTNGKALCGSISPILADYGKVSEQGCSANVYHASGSISSSNTGDTLKSGDIVKTGACGLTIAFTDLSILRLDADTTVSLDVLTPPAPSTQTIASAILENGSLWGRILTDTGSYSIGTDKIVAGVRGTSIALVSTGWTLSTPSFTSTGWQITKSAILNANTDLVIVDSVNTSSLTNPAATVYCRGTGGTATPLNNMNPENQYTIATSGAGCVPAIPPRALTSSAATLYARSPWIRRNTGKDVSYMYRLLALSGTTLKNPTKISNELTLSQPPDVPGDQEAGNICEYPQVWWNGRYGCQAQNILAQADYTLPEISQSGPLTGVIPSLYIRGANVVTPASMTSSAGSAASPLSGLYGTVTYTNMSGTLSGDWTMEIEIEGSALSRSSGGPYQLFSLVSSGVLTSRIYSNSGSLYLRGAGAAIPITGISASSGKQKIILQKIGTTYKVIGTSQAVLATVSTSTSTNDTLYLGSNNANPVSALWLNNIYSVKIFQ